MSSFGARAVVGREVRRIVGQLTRTMLRWRLRDRWSPSPQRLASRVYPDYAAYVKHQRTKFDAMRHRSLRNHDSRFYDALRSRLRSLPHALHGKSVLCLGARQGSEVRAFIDAGAFALGVDLNPGRDNRYVVSGDFHALQFAAGTVDVVYTNALDHAFDLDRILDEVRRVLATGGLFIAEVGPGSEEGGQPGFYESLVWPHVAELIRRMADRGFELECRSRFEHPWPGEQLVLRARVPSDAISSVS
jgi:SAM-dependent methyltransferase